MAIWQSCPHACIAPSFCEAKGTPVCSVTGSASISVRKAMMRLAFAVVGAGGFAADGGDQADFARLHIGNAHGVQLGGERFGGLDLVGGKLRVGMEIAAPLDDVRFNVGRQRLDAAGEGIVCVGHAAPPCWVYDFAPFYKKVSRRWHLRKGWGDRAKARGCSSPGLFRSATLLSHGKKPPECAFWARRSAKSGLSGEIAAKCAPCAGFAGGKTRIRGPSRHLRRAMRAFRSVLAR